tara:strand:- start:313 stop:627 length:315 start_codon:yes stop_codon:yes gene_type:complete
MRVKLSYTVEEDQVLPESAKILGLASDHMQHCIFLYGEVQRKLLNAPVEGDEHMPTDAEGALELIEEFRQALLNVDTRLSEVVEIVEGYEEYKEKEKNPEVLKG